MKWIKCHTITQTFDGHRGGWTEGHLATCEITGRDLPAVLLERPRHNRIRHWYSPPGDPVRLTVYAKTAAEVQTIARRARGWFDPTTGGK